MFQYYIFSKHRGIFQVANEKIYISYSFIHIFCFTCRINTQLKFIVIKRRNQIPCSSLTEATQTWRYRRKMWITDWCRVICKQWWHQGNGIFQTVGAVWRWCFQEICIDILAGVQLWEKSWWFWSENLFLDI